MEQLPPSDDVALEATRRHVTALQAQLDDLGLHDLSQPLDGCVDAHHAALRLADTDG